MAVVPATGAIVAAGIKSRDQDFAVMRLPGDAAPPLPTLTVNDVSVAEGNAGTIPANFTVTLSAAVAVPGDGGRGDRGWLGGGARRLHGGADDQHSVPARHHGPSRCRSR